MAHTITIDGEKYDVDLPDVISDDGVEWLVTNETPDTGETVIYLDFNGSREPIPRKFVTVQDSDTHEICSYCHTLSTLPYRANWWRCGYCETKNRTFDG